MIPLNKFNKKVIEKGKEIYDDDKIKCIYKFNSIYYGKVAGTCEDYYNVSIDNKKGFCNCDYDDSPLCKHLYAFNKKVNECPNLVDLYKNLEKLSKSNLLNIVNTAIEDNQSIPSKIIKELDQEELKLDNEKYLQLLNNIQEETNNILYQDLEYDEIDEEVDYTDLEDSIKKLLNVLKKDKVKKNLKILNYLKKFKEKLVNVHPCSSFDAILNYLI